MIVKTIFGDEVNFDDSDVSINLCSREIVDVHTGESVWILIMRPTKDEGWTLLAVYPKSDLMVAAADLADLLRAYDEGAEIFKLPNIYDWKKLGLIGEYVMEDKCDD